MTAKTPLIELRDLQKHYRINKGIFGHRTRGTVKAVDSISLSIAPEETLGLIGESGCGKSTLSRVLLGLPPATGGVRCAAANRRQRIRPPAHTAAVSP